MLAESNRRERKTNQRKAGHVHANMCILCITGLYHAAQAALLAKEKTAEYHRALASSE